MKTTGDIEVRKGDLSNCLELLLNRIGNKSAQLYVTAADILNSTHENMILSHITIERLQSQICRTVGITVPHSSGFFDRDLSYENKMVTMETKRSTSGTLHDGAEHEIFNADDAG